MGTFLFHNVVFGPVLSRRLGLSLGINLLPLNRKICNFNCIYCECGWTEAAVIPENEYPPRELVKEKLIERLKELAEQQHLPEAITFAGNGEPTLHPLFSEIIDDTIEARNIFAPDAKVTVLSNASGIVNDKIFEALKKIDNNILKLDAGSQETLAKINRPLSECNLELLTDRMKSFHGKMIIQSLFLRGEVDGIPVDNVSDEEIKLWLKIVCEVKPSLVMIYPVARSTPGGGIEKVSREELEAIAARVNACGIETMVVN
ncbi:MAG: radical SAM protein [Bacteroidota bacterium]